MIALRLLLPLALLAGCAASQDGYPSLAPRAVETRSWDEPAAPPPAPLVTDPALDRSLAEQSRALASADTAFKAAAARARTLATAAAGDPAGGERWITAQTALGDLDVQRAATVDVSEALHQLALDRAETGAADYPALESATAAADAQLQAETQAIADLQDRLPSG